MSIGVLGPGRKLEVTGALAGPLLECGIRPEATCWFWKGGAEGGPEQRDGSMPSAYIASWRLLLAVEDPRLS